MKKVTGVEVQIAVLVPEGEEPTAVLSRVTEAAYALKKAIGETEVFRVNLGEVPVQEK